MKKKRKRNNIIIDEFGIAVYKLTDSKNNNYYFGDYIEFIQTNKHIKKFNDLDSKSRKILLSRGISIVELTEENIDNKIKKFDIQLLKDIPSYCNIYLPDFGIEI